MKIIKAAKSIYVIYAVLMFLITMMTVFPCILIFSLLNEKRKEKCNYWILRAWSFVWYKLIFLRHKSFYSEVYDKRKQYIYVANHSSYLDIPQLLLAVKRPIIILGRHDLAAIPVFGIIYKSVTISVDRSQIKERANSYQQLKNVLQNGSSVFIFPEGSFNETGNLLKPFHDGAFRLSAEMNIPIKPIIFPDNIKRLHYKTLFSLSPGICRSVFLKDIYPDTSKANPIVALKQEVFYEMESALRKS